MALHDRLPYPGITEPTYKQIGDLEIAATRYSRAIFNDVTDELVDSIVSGSHAYHACINNILIPETRGMLDSVNYAELSSGAKRNMGTVPAQNMDGNAVKTWMVPLGERIMSIDRMDLDGVNHTIFYQPDLHALFNSYPAGALLTKSEIIALKKNRLCPHKDYHADVNGIIDAVNFSKGALCTGYIQLLDDALQAFKSYFTTILGKCISDDSGELVYPRRIVYDRSRLVKSCFNPVINEAAQIALECDYIRDGGAYKIAIHLNNDVKDNGEMQPYVQNVVQMLYTPLRAMYENGGSNSLRALAYVIGYTFYSGDLEAQDK